MTFLIPKRRLQRNMDETAEMLLIVCPTHWSLLPRRPTSPIQLIKTHSFHHQTSTTHFPLTPCSSCLIPLQFPICFYPLPCSPLSSHLISPSTNLVLFTPNPRYQRPNLSGTKRQHPCPHINATATLTWRSWLPWLPVASCSAAPAPSWVKEEVKGKGKVEGQVAYLGIPGGECHHQEQRRHKPWCRARQQHSGHQKLHGALGAAMLRYFSRNVSIA
jgi:hypothetical protein